LKKLIAATVMLRTRATGMIEGAAIPLSAKRARYPDAPPCPIDEYNVATRKKRGMRIQGISCVGID
jgi:hypothetical protein